MISLLTTIATTTTGKILLGSLAAATVLGGAAATGLVDAGSTETATDLASNAAVGANGTVATTVENGFRVNAGNAGSFGAAVAEGELRLSDISSQAGWSGQLVASSADGMTISFSSDVDVDRTITAQLTLIAAADSTNVAKTFVLATVNNEDGTTTTTRFGANGSVVGDYEFAATLGAGLDTAADTVKTASAIADDSVSATTASVQATTDTARETATDAVGTATATVDETVTTTTAAVTATTSAAASAGTAAVQATTDTAITTGSDTITTATGAVQATTENALETITGTNLDLFGDASIETDASATVQAAPVEAAAAVDVTLGASLELGLGS